MRKIISLIILLGFLLPGVTFGSSRLLHFDAEDCAANGADWDYTGRGLMIVYQQDPQCATFTCRSTGAYSGSYSLESHSPNEQCTGAPEGNTSDSVIRFYFNQVLGHNLTWGEDIFVRYKVRLPTDWCDEASDAGSCPNPTGGTNHLRLRGVPGTNDLEVQLGYAGDGSLGTSGWFAWYGGGHTNTKYPPRAIDKDNQWHEIAFYIRAPTSSSVGNGIFRVWKDANGTYTEANALWNYTDNNWSAGEYSYLQASLCYYKGPVNGNWTFWIDEFEVWDGLPSETPDTTPPIISGPQPQGSLSCTSDPRSTALTLITNEYATCRYGTGTTWASMSPMSTTGGTSHSQTVSLACGSSYQYNFMCQDSSQNQSSMAAAIFSIAAPGDMIAPTVDVFTIPPSWSSLTVPVLSFSASDAVGVTGYLITTSASTPIISNPGWSVTPQEEYIFTSAGTKTLYAWARDAAGNISTSLSDTVTITLPACSNTPSLCTTESACLSAWPAYYWCDGVCQSQQCSSPTITRVRSFGIRVPYFPAPTYVYTDDFNRSNGDPGSNWGDLDYLAKLAIVNNRVTGSTYLAMQKWVGADLGPDHYAQVQYISGSEPIELGVRDIEATTSSAYFDRFDRANGAPGGSWNASNIVISSQRIAPATSAGGYAIYQGASIEDDQFSAYTLAATGNGVFVFARSDTDTMPAYALIVEAETTGTRNWYVGRYDAAGAWTQLSTGTITSAANRQIYLVVQGSNPVVLHAAYGNEQIARVEDSAAERIASGGYPGLGFNSGGTSGRIDNWAGGSVSGCDIRYWMYDDPASTSGIGWSIDGGTTLGGDIHVWAFLATYVQARSSGNVYKLSVDGTAVSLLMNGVTSLATATDDLVPATAVGSKTDLGIFGTSTYCDNFAVGAIP